MTRVLISNTYADDNRGGAALTSAAIAAAEAVYPEAEVSLLTLVEDAEELRQTHRHTLRDHPNVTLLPTLLPVTGRAARIRSLTTSVAMLACPRRLLRRSRRLRPLLEADVVIGKGGQIFRNRDRGGLLALWVVVWPLLMAAHLGIPCALYGQAFGPFRQRSTRLLSGWILRRVDVVLLRDAVSMAHAAEVGAGPPRTERIPDTVFGLSPPEPDLVAAVRARYGLQGVRFCAVTAQQSMTIPVLRGRAIEPLSELLRALLDAGVVERVLVVLQTDGPGTSDRGASERLVRACGDERVTLADDDLSWRELSALYAAATLVIGGRVHSNILSMLGGTPAFPLDFGSGKADAIFATFGMADRVIRVDEVSTVVALRRILGVVGSETARREVAEVRDTLRAESEVRRDLLPAPRMSLLPGGRR